MPMGLLTSKLGGLVPSEARNGNFQVPPTIVVSDTDSRFVVFAAETTFPFSTSDFISSNTGPLGGPNWCFLCYTFKIHWLSSS